MGRGRQKAKQTKVARDLKYYSPPTDLSALQRELAARESSSTETDDEYGSDIEDTDDEWASPSSRRR